MTAHVNSCKRDDDVRGAEGRLTSFNVAKRTTHSNIVMCYFRSNNPPPVLCIPTARLAVIHMLQYIWYKPCCDGSACVGVAKRVCAKFAILSAHQHAGFFFFSSQLFLCAQSANCLIVATQGRAGGLSLTSQTVNRHCKKSITPSGSSGQSPF